MKKLIIIALLSMIALGGGFSVSAAEREKIPSPVELKNFRDVVKEGGDLFGVRITDPAKVETRKESTESLEKIKTPAEIQNYEVIKKIGTALWGLRKQLFKQPVLIKPEAEQCVSKAMDKKDAALKTLLKTTYDKALVAIAARTWCKKAALAETVAEDQAKSIKACAESYQSAMRQINYDLKMAKEDNWKVFRSDLKACSKLQGAATPAEEIQMEDGETSMQ